MMVLNSINTLSSNFPNQNEKWGGEGGGLRWGWGVNIESICAG